MMGDNDGARVGVSGMGGGTLSSQTGRFFLCVVGSNDTVPAFQRGISTGGFNPRFNLISMF